MMDQKIKLIIDTREQEPLTFSEYVDVEFCRDKLECGDYTLAAHDLAKDDNSIMLERKKNCNELLTNLGSKWEQFSSQMYELSKYKNKQIIVCAPANFEYLYDRGFTKMSPNFVYKQLSFLYLEYGISCIFLPDRLIAENYMFRLFKHIVQLEE